MDYMKINKWAKGMAYGFIGAFIGVFILLCIAVGAKNKTIKNYKSELKAQTEQIDSLKKYNRELGELNGLQVNVTFQFTQKNVLSFSQNNCQNIAKEVAQLTRKELLDSLKINK